MHRHLTLKIIIKISETKIKMIYSWAQGSYFKAAYLGVVPSLRHLSTQFLYSVLKNSVSRTERSVCAVTLLSTMSVRLNAGCQG